MSNYSSILYTSCLPLVQSYFNTSIHAKFVDQIFCRTRLYQFFIYINFVQLTQKKVFMLVYDIILSTLLAHPISFPFSKSKLIFPTYVLKFIFNPSSKYFATIFAAFAKRLIVRWSMCFVTFSFFLSQSPFPQKMLISRVVTERLLPKFRGHHRLI